MKNALRNRWLVTVYDRETRVVHQNEFFRTRKEAGKYLATQSVRLHQREDIGLIDLQNKPAKCNVPVCAKCGGKIRDKEYISLHSRVTGGSQYQHLNACPIGGR